MKVQFLKGGKFMIMNQKSKKIFIDSFETSVMYYRYLHLGCFYSQLSKRESLSCKAKDIWVNFDKNKFLLREDVIKSSLEDMYNKWQSPDFFYHLILNNSIRGITMALFEALKEEEIKELFLKHFFKNRKEAYDNFEGVLRFIRNTFSHNIRDRIELRKEDYLRKKGKSNLNFFFDYAEFPVPINKENYIVKIDIDFDQIKEEVIYTDIISEYQTLLFIEFCYNCMVYLELKLDELSSHTV